MSTVRSIRESLSTFLQRVVTFSLIVTTTLSCSKRTVGPQCAEMGNTAYADVLVQKFGEPDKKLDQAFGQIWAYEGGDGTCLVWVYDSPAGRLVHTHTQFNPVSGSPEMAKSDNTTAREGIPTPTPNEPHGETISATAAQSSARRLLKESGKSGELIMVLSGSLGQSVGTDGSRRFNTQSWVFFFRDTASTSTTSIEVTPSGDGVQSSTPVAKISQFSFPQKKAGEFKAINGWKLDNTEAEDIIRKVGGVPDDGTFMIKMRDVDGVFLPVWILPYRFGDGTERGVRADNGAIVFLLRDREDKWTSTPPR